MPPLSSVNVRLPGSRLTREGEGAMLQMLLMLRQFSVGNDCVGRSCRLRGRESHRDLQPSLFFLCRDKRRYLRVAHL
jgi:hypothetical protein